MPALFGCKSSSFCPRSFRVVCTRCTERSAWNAARGNPRELQRALRSGRDPSGSLPSPAVRASPLIARLGLAGREMTAGREGGRQAVSSQAAVSPRSSPRASPSQDIARPHAHTAAPSCALSVRLRLGSRRWPADPAGAARRRWWCHRRDAGDERLASPTEYLPGQHRQQVRRDT